MRHARKEVIERAIGEFALLDALVSRIGASDWERPIIRREGEDAWTVKDALAHITHHKAEMARGALGLPASDGWRRLGVHARNHEVFERWHDRPSEEVVEWHRQVQREVLVAMEGAPEGWFTGEEHTRPWPAAIDGHSAGHRVRDIERVVFGAAAAGRTSRT